jgi:hypothetical protein
MYRVVAVSASGEHAIEDVASARAALALGRRLIATGHTDIMVTTPDERAFLFREFAALMNEPDKPGDS